MIRTLITIIILFLFTGCSNFNQILNPNNKDNSEHIITTKKALIESGYRYKQIDTHLYVFTNVKGFKLNSVKYNTIKSIYNRELNLIAPNDNKDIYIVYRSDIPDMIAGFFSIDDWLVLNINVNHESDLVPTIIHEMTHLLLERNIKNYKKIPIWYNEFLAIYMERYLVNEFNTLRNYNKYILYSCKNSITYTDDINCMYGNLFYQADYVYRYYSAPNIFKYIKNNSEYYYTEYGLFYNVLKTTKTQYYRNLSHYRGF